MLQHSTTLAPSEKAMGLNQYLGKMEFSVMVMAAVGLHLLGLAVFSLIPPQEVQNVPVRVMNLKLSDDEGITAAPRFSSDILQQFEADEPMDEPIEEVALEPKSVEKIEPKPAQKTQPATPKLQEKVQQGVTIKKEAPKPKEVAPLAPKPVKEKRISVREKTSPLSPEATPRQKVRADRVAQQGSASSRQQKQREEIVRRYEQTLSQWLARHKLYPPAARAQGVEGEGVVRLRINRLGNVIYAAVENSTGARVLDEALIAMVKRANPVPRVPDNYPAGQLFEFLIPIRFYKVAE